MLATALTTIYLYYTIKLNKDSLNDDDPYHEEFYTDIRKTSVMQWIISAIFTVMIILMSMSLMC